MTLPRPKTTQIVPRYPFLSLATLANATAALSDISLQVSGTMLASSVDGEDHEQVKGEGMLKMSVTYGQ